MMKNLIMATALGLALPCIFFSSPGQAGEALDTLNAEITQRVRQLDEQYGVLLTYTERANLKIGLIVARLKESMLQQPEKPLQALVDEAITTYEVTDPVEQRQLLIETQMSVSYSNGSGIKPPCCN